MEPTTEPILSQDYDLEKRSVDFDKNGNFRWPFGLINRCAWKITDRRLFGEISNRKFRREGSLGIDPLTAEETTAVMQLAREEVRLLLPIRARARIEGDSVARRRVSPPPALTRQGIMYLRREPAFTYAMSIERARGGSFKIGWAFDYTLRQRQFNQAAMPTLGGLEYRTVLHRLWDTAQQAYRMEQWLLQQFDANRHLENHEVIVGVPYSELEDSWVSYLQHSSGR